MSKILLIVLLLFFGNSSAAEEKTTLYEDLLALEFMKERFDSKVTGTGIDFDSKDKFQTTKDMSISKIHINLEGPFPIPLGTTLNQAMEFNIDSVINTTELNKKFPKKNRVAEGMGAIKLDVNGFEVGYMEYQVPSMNMAKFRRAVIVKEDRMYGFTIVLFDPTVDKKRGLVFDMLVIAAVNSGKL